MAGSAPTPAIRWRLSTFARGVARPFPDSRRRWFVTDMIRGLVVGGHVLVVGWRVPNSERPLVLLVSPAARRTGRTGRWYVRAYHKRWGLKMPPAG